MIELLMILLIILPFAAGVLVFILSARLRNFCVVLFAAVNLLIAVLLFKQNALFSFAWAGFGMDFSLRLYLFSSFIILAAAFFSLLIILYALDFMKDRSGARLFFAFFFISVSFINGALLSDNLVLLLFFWEGLLLTVYALIAAGGKTAFKTATKALVIVGVSDLCMMAGVALTGHLAATLTISQISLKAQGPAALAFILLIIGAIAKAGSMPFHTWIPDAAEDAPLPFMAFFPAALEKLLGIYLLVRITLDLFKLESSSFLSTALMIVGACTIILAVMMALVQKDYKRLLSYHAISQVGYMVLGIGTCLPVGIIGGIFHMFNNAVYKCGLFLTAGAVEKQAGSTDLHKLGGLWKKMPVTFFCFLITAASISGVPPFNGFFSKELIYDAALGRGFIFYLAALVGSFFTAASFLKLGHAAFLGAPACENRQIKEAPVSLLVPMLILSFSCILFGLFNHLLVNGVIWPAVAESFTAHGLVDHQGINWLLVFASIIVLSAAFAHHCRAVKNAGSGIKASEHIHNALVLSRIYALAERGYFDPYRMGKIFIRGFSGIFWKLDRMIDWFYDSFAVKISYILSRGISRAHSGYYVVYVIWSLLGAVSVLLFIIYS